MLLCPGVALEEGLIYFSVCSFSEAALSGDCDAPPQSTFCPPDSYTLIMAGCLRGYDVEPTQRAFHFLLLHFNNPLSTGASSMFQVAKKTHYCLVLLKGSSIQAHFQNNLSAFTLKKIQSPFILLMFTPARKHQRPRGRLG